MGGSLVLFPTWRILNPPGKKLTTEGAEEWDKGQSFVQIHTTSNRIED
jgi:hypothetical protein